MKRSILSCAIAALVCGGSIAHAANELVIQVSKGGKAAQGLTAKLDGKVVKSVDSNGMAIFDLDGGSHSIQIMNGEELVHNFRFDTASGQYSDISVSLGSDKPKVAIESYFNAESSVQKAKAAKGALAGRVKSGGMPVAGATILAEGTDYSVVTDADGEYRLDLPRGLYTIKISHPDFGGKTIDTYRVVANVIKGSDFAISNMSQAVEEVVVLAKYNPSAFGENERYATNVVDTMGIEELARFGDSDVSASVVRMPSVTIQSDRFIFIRGLGGRYVSTSLNGATMPSTNPSKRTVPLDLFPSNIVQQLDVSKTFKASMPGESTGGNLVINTRAFPEEQAGKLSISLGYVDGVTGEESMVDSQSGDYDILGWDDGTRDVPGIVPAISDAISYGNLSSANEVVLGRLGALEIKDKWDYATENATPDVSISANYGDIFMLDSLDADLSVFTAVNYKNEWKKKDKGIERTYGGAGNAVEDDFSFEEYGHDINASGLISLGLNIGESTFQATTLISRVTEESVRYSEGFDADSLFDSIRWDIEWVEREFLSQQFKGDHVISEPLTADWQFTVSKASRNAPDRREVRFDLEQNDGVYNLQVPALLRIYEELNDENFDASTNFEYLLTTDNDVESSLSFGAQIISRERDSDSNSYGFRGGLISVDDNAPNLSVSDVLTDANITGDASTGYTLQDKTLASDSYEAEMDLTSAYLSYEALFHSEYQLIVGARYEDFDLQVDTFDLQNGEPVTAELNEADVLPSLSFNWLYQEDEQVRFAVTQTIARPDFKEKSLAVFYDKELGVRVRGNAELEDSLVTNFDVRWEKYWEDDELVSVAFFYKDMQDPIERVALPASGTVGDSRTFQNADSAEVSGIEVEGKKVFAFNDAYTQSLFVTVNASLIDSEVTLDGSSETRNLQGAPDYTFNLVLGYDDIENGHEVTLLFNQSGETIVDVGTLGQADIIEEPRLDVSMNYKYDITDDMVFKAKIKNILNSEVEFTQDGKVYQSYEKGMKFQAGIDWKF